MNGYHETPLCEHRFAEGETCPTPAAFAIRGVLLCETHFEDRVTAASVQSPNAAADLRFAAKALP